MEEDIGPAVTAIYDTNKEEESTTPGSVDRDVAVSETLPPASSTGDDVSLYQLKWVEWKGGFVPVVTQNENGPCPLLALCNVLILGGRMKIPPGETIVTSTFLLDLLGACILENDPKDLSNGERANYEQNVQDAVSVFPKLQTGLDVNVKFNSVSGFEFTCESGLFDILGMHLYHGWLADPQDSGTWEVVGQCTYNRLVEKIINDRASEDPAKLQEALIAEQFLDSTASQLTYHGLCELNTAVKEGELCVFFRNNHFSTLHKRKAAWEERTQPGNKSLQASFPGCMGGENAAWEQVTAVHASFPGCMGGENAAWEHITAGHLLLLVTDHGFLNEQDHVWEVLSNVEGDGDFLDAQFRWSNHSEMQQSRENQTKQAAEGSAVEGKEKVEKDVGQQPTPTHPPGNTNLDYETALGLQQQEYNPEPMPSVPAAVGGPPPTHEQRLLTDEALAAQLQQAELPPHKQGSPPSSREDYERAAAMERGRRSSPSDSCNLL